MGIFENVTRVSESGDSRSSSSSMSSSAAVVSSGRGFKQIIQDISCATLNRLTSDCAPGLSVSIWVSLALAFLLGFGSSFGSFITF